MAWPWTSALGLYRTIHIGSASRGIHRFLNANVTIARMAEPTFCTVEGASCRRALSRTDSESDGVHAASA